jgi:hypothetical protein
MTISLAFLAPDLVKAAWTNDGERSAQRENPDGARSVIRARASFIPPGLHRGR